MQEKLGRASSMVVTLGQSYTTVWGLLGQGTNNTKQEEWGLRWASRVGGGKEKSLARPHACIRMYSVVDAPLRSHVGSRH